MEHADPLHRMKELARAEESRASRVITVTSGKGGVGKTNLALNLSLALSRLNKQVALFDADTRCANIDLLIGRQARHSVLDVILGNKDFSSITEEIDTRIELVSAGHVEDHQKWEDKVKELFFHDIYRKRFSHDYIIIDTSAGLTQTMMDFALQGDEVLVLTTPEPPAINDAYALMKLLSGRKHKTLFRIIINLVQNEKEAKEVFDRFRLVTEKFLKIAPIYGGYIREDNKVRRAVKEQQPLLTTFPGSRAAKNISKIAEELVK